jgi:hypothetical protein
MAGELARETEIIVARLDDLEKKADRASAKAEKLRDRYEVALKESISTNKEYLNALEAHKAVLETMGVRKPR